MTGKLRRTKNFFRNTHEVNDQQLWYLDAGTMKVSIFDGGVSREGFGPDIILMFYKGQRKFGFEVTSFNAEELAKLRETWNEVMDLAEVIVKGRDDAARAAEASSDSIFYRLYRPVPRLVTTPRAKRIDRESILDRPVDVFEGDESDDDS